MDKNKRILLKIFDLVDDISFDTDMKTNILYIKFKKIINCCPVCGSIKLLSKGYYTSELVACPFNGKPTIIKCKVKRFVCQDCSSYKNTNMTNCSYDYIK